MLSPRCLFARLYSPCEHPLCPALPVGALRSAVSFFGVATLILTGCKHVDDVAPQHAAVTVAASHNQFVDVAEKAGVRFTHNNGAFGKKWLPETMGSGVGFIDYDGDGYPDIFVANGRGWTPQELKEGGAAGQSHVPVNTTCHLFHNNGNGTFTDVTAGSGLDIPVYGMGVSIGDYDNDGKPDIYLTALGRNYLFHNDGNGKFRDVAKQAGVSSAGWSTGSAWVDYDRDGKLDLFVCHYVKWTPATDLFTSLDGTHKSYARPNNYSGDHDQLFHNNGDGTFSDVSAKAGILKRPEDSADLQSKSLGVAICDYDNDGWPDIVVTNDTQPNYLFHNEHNGTFKESGTGAAIAYGEQGNARGAMGVDAADYDHSGHQSLIIGNFTNEELALYQNTGNNLFVDAAAPTSIGPATLLSLSFGVSFIDYDNDGWPDILIANGHVDDDIASINKQVTYAEKPLLFHNDGGDQFTNVSATSGPALQQPMVARGLAYADIDLDGSLDVAITTNGGPLRIWHNSGGSNHALRLELEGVRSNRSAIGARVQVDAGAAKDDCMVHSGASYLSQSELPITCGLGTSGTGTVTITWPAGGKTTLPALKAGQIYHVVEGKGITSSRPYAHTAAY